MRTFDTTEKARRGRVFTLVATTITLAALAVAPAASSDPSLASYTDAMTGGGNLSLGVPAELTFTIRNCPELAPLPSDPCGANLSALPIKWIELTVPDGFIVKEKPSIVDWDVVAPTAYPTNGQSQTVKLAASSGTNGVLPGEEVPVHITVTPIGFTATGALPGKHQSYTFTTAAFSGDPGAPPVIAFDRVNTNPLTATVSAPFGNAVICESSTCTASATFDGTTVAATATGTQPGDTLSVAIVDRNTNQCDPARFMPDPNSYGGVVYLKRPGGSTPSLSIEWRLAKKKVNVSPNNGVDTYEACYGGQNKQSPASTFPARDGTTSTAGLDGQQWGVLADCASIPQGFPCLAKRSKNNAGDVVLLTSSPWPWDPSIYGG